MNKNNLIFLGLFISIVTIIFFSLNFFQAREENNNRIAVITQNHKLVERIDLNTVTEPREIILPGKYHEIIEVEKGRIRFKEADCPDKICVKTGWLTKVGDIAVCLPNKAIIKIED